MIFFVKTGERIRRDHLLLMYCNWCRWFMICSGEELVHVPPHQTHIEYREEQGSTSNSCSYGFAVSLVMQGSDYSFKCGTVNDDGLWDPSYNIPQRFQPFNRPVQIFLHGSQLQPSLLRASFCCMPANICCQPYPASNCELYIKFTWGRSVCCCSPTPCWVELDASLWGAIRSEPPNIHPVPNYISIIIIFQMNLLPDLN